jgi:hypothetical protein
MKTEKELHISLTRSQEAEGTIEVTFINVSEDIRALCKYLLVDAEYDHLESSNHSKKDNQSASCIILARPVAFTWCNS